MLVTSLETEGEANRFPPVLLPAGSQLAQLRRGLGTRRRSAHFFLNSALVTLVVLVSNLVFCSLAGYAFARIRFLGRGALFVTLMATLMVPFQVTMIPVFLIVKRDLGLVGIDHIGALMLPNLATRVRHLLPAPVLPDGPGRTRGGRPGRRRPRGSACCSRSCCRCRCPRCRRWPR